MFILRWLSEPEIEDSTFRCDPLDIHGMIGLAETFAIPGKLLEIPVRREQRPQSGLVILKADRTPSSVKGRPSAGAVHLEPEYMTAVGIALAIVPLGRMRSRDINDVPITRGALGIEFPITRQEHDLVGFRYETILGDDGVARFASFIEHGDAAAFGPGDRWAGDSAQRLAFLIRVAFELESCASAPDRTFGPNSRR
jgi:hypothetical protein